MNKKIRALSARTVTRDANYSALELASVPGLGSDPDPDPALESGSFGSSCPGSRQVGRSKPRREARL